jgi:nucleotide-binding universal stress UspA family protein
MYTHLLVAVDGSDTSNLAVKEAVKLAKKQNATVRLVHVVDETPAYTMAEMPFPISEYKKLTREAGESYWLIAPRQFAIPESPSTRNV